MPDTDTLEPEAEQDDQLDGQQEGDQSDDSDQQSPQKKKKGSSHRPSLKQTQKLSKGMKGPSSAGGGGAAGGAGGSAASGAGSAGGEAVVAGGTAVGGPVLIVVGIVLFIILVIIILIFVFGKSAAGDPNAAQLTITKTGPAAAAINDPLPYQIVISYPGTAQDIIIQDPIPAGTDYVDSIPPAKFDATTRTATWNLKDFIASRGGVLASPSATLNINLKATADNSYLVNQAQGTVIGAGTPPGGGGPNNPPNTSSNDFDTLMVGQGRNTGILGDRASFIAAVLKNGAGLASGFSSGRYSDQLGQIYDSAVAKNVNPLIVTTIWGVEASFELNNTEFGCMPFGSGFAKQMSCSINTLNNLMTEFDDLKSKGPVDLAGCPTFTDAFLYAYEYYTPVCHAADGNDASRKNFVTIFKQLYGK